MKTKEKICRRKSLLWSMLFLLLFGWFLPLLLTNGIMSIMATRKVHTQIDTVRITVGCDSHVAFSVQNIVL